MRRIYNYRTDPFIMKYLLRDWYLGATTAVSLIGAMVTPVKAVQIQGQYVINLDENGYGQVDLTDLLGSGIAVPTAPSGTVLKVMAVQISGPPQRPGPDYGNVGFNQQTTNIYYQSLATVCCDCQLDHFWYEIGEYPANGPFDVPPWNNAWNNVIVQFINAAPVAEDDFFTTVEGVPLCGNILTNDKCGESLMASILSLPTNGVLTATDGAMLSVSNVIPNGDLCYTPAENWPGKDVFTYQVSDQPMGTCISKYDSATVTISDNPSHVVIAPVVSGHTNISVGQKSPYRIFHNSKCNQGHCIQCRFDFGDGTTSAWSTATIVDHVWFSSGDYAVQCQARCALSNDVVSAWSSPIMVQVWNHELLGIEVMQSVQNWSNNVRLVADKRTYARIHVATHNEKPDQMTCQVVFSQAGQSTTNTYSFTAPTSTGESFDSTQALNAVVPITYCSSNLTVAVLSEGLVPAPSFIGNPDGRSVSVQFEDTTKLPVRIVLFSYKSASGYVRGVRTDDVQDVLGDAISRLPFARFRFAADAAGKALPHRQESLTNQPATESDMTVLINRLNQIKLEELQRGVQPANVVYIGLLLDNEHPQEQGPWISTPGITRKTASLCVAYVKSGYFQGRVLSDNSFVPDSDATMTLSHELGHVFGCKHVACSANNPPPAPNTIDAKYPYSDGRISDEMDPLSGDAYYGAYLRYGNLSDLFGPDTPDLMTYARPRWPSKYTFEKIMDGFRTTSGSAAIRRLKFTRSTAAAPGIFVSVTANADGLSGAIGEVRKLDDASSFSAPDPGPFAIVLFSNDVQLVRHDLHLDPDSESEEPLAGCFVLPWPEGVNLVSLFYGATLLDTRILAGSVPQIELVLPAGGGTLDVTEVAFQWIASDPDGDALTFSADYSPDGGSNWWNIVTGFTNQSTTIEIGDIKASTNARFRVGACDGLFTVYDTTDDPYLIPNFAPEVTIVVPPDGAVFTGAEPIEFRAQGFDRDDGILPEDSFVWESSLDGVLSSNSSSFQLGGGEPSDGEHTINVQVTDSEGLVATGQISIVVARDVDLDGLPDSWESEHGLPTDSSIGVYGATGDYDDDGMPNLDEYNANTHPTNPASVLAVSGVSISDGLVRLNWIGGTAAWQFVETSFSLGTNEQWKILLTNPPPTESSSGQAIGAPTDYGQFFRIRAHR